MAAWWLLAAPATLQTVMWLIAVYKPINYLTWWGWTIMIPRLVAVLFISMVAWMISAIALFWGYVP